MQAARQDALKTISQLPDSADMEEIMYRLYVLDKVRKGQEDIEQGRHTPASDLKQEIDQW
jgi:predicted transcriptional regulator